MRRFLATVAIVALGAVGCSSSEADEPGRWRPATPNMSPQDVVPPRLDERTPTRSVQGHEFPTAPTTR